MSRWLETTLGEACELYQPKTISSAELVADGEYPVYGAKELSGGSISLIMQSHSYLSLVAVLRAVL